MARVDARMHRDMAVTPSGDVDRDFMRMMIPHHQGAIDTALVVLKYGTDERLEHVRRSRTEPGCIAHAVHQDAENPSRLVFVEEWADQAALAAHFAVPASRAFAQAVATLAVEPPVMTVFEAERIRPGGR